MEWYTDYNSSETIRETGSASRNHAEMREFSRNRDQSILLPRLARLKLLQSATVSESLTLWLFPRTFSVAVPTRKSQLSTSSPMVAAFAQFVNHTSLLIKPCHFRHRHRLLRTARQTRNKTELKESQPALTIS